MTRARYIFALLLISAMASGQSLSQGRKFWQLDLLNGAVQAGASYRYLAGTTNEIYNTQQSSLIYGGIRLNTGSHFWHPNFMWVDLGVEYNPEKGQDLYLIVPDQSEVRTLKKLDAAVTFFRLRSLNFGGFINLNQSYNNRENLSNIRSNSCNWGGNFSWTNKVLPVNITYRQGEWKDHEISTGRTFDTRQSTLEADLRKSFSTRDNNELRYYHNDFSRKDFNLARTANTADILNLNDVISFDTKRNYVLTSFISATDQRGDDAFRRLQADENITFRLPKRLDLVTNYSYFYDLREPVQTSQHLINGTLTHRLYESLTTAVHGEYSHITHSIYKEGNVIAGIDIRYDKKIPFGQLSLAYKFNWQEQQRKGESLPLEILHESHTLTDGNIELLGKPFITPGTVVVKDVTGTIIYQENFDYILLPRGDYVEIQRVPGGQIPNNGTVFADYYALQPGSYKYDADFNQFSVNLLMFKRIVEVYYRYGKQDYFNLQTTDFLILNYFTQHLVGCRLEYKFASGGVEYESYQSTILPYRLLHYFVVLQGQIKSRLNYSINGNVRDYRMISDAQDQLYVDLTGKAGYMIGRQTGISVECGYRKQVGQGIDLNLLMARAEFTTMFRQFQVHIGVESYGRDYLHENTSFIGANIRIVRTFNWNRK